jgi:hypothetical protein
MPDIATVADAIRDRMTAEWPHVGVPVYYENEENELSDTPEAFLHVSVETFSQQLAAYGGGRGNNRWRQQGAIIIRVFVPRGAGRAVADGYAEDAAVIFRGQRFYADVDCFGAGVVSAGVADAPNGNYWLTEVEVDLSFDLIG